MLCLMDSFVVLSGFVSMFLVCAFQFWKIVCFMFLGPDGCLVRLCRGWVGSCAFCLS